MCVQSPGWWRRRTIRGGSGFTGGLHHLLLHLPPLTGERAQFAASSFILSIFIPALYFTSPFFSLPVFCPVVFLSCLSLCVSFRAPALSVCARWVLRPLNCLSPSRWTVCRFLWLRDLSLTLWVYTGRWVCLINLKTQCESFRWLICLGVCVCVRIASLFFSSSRMTVVMLHRSPRPRVLRCLICAA